MQIVMTIAFRYLTEADFFNINKPIGTETGGGGQSYIDFPTASITVPEWRKFFAGVKDLDESQGQHGPAWLFPIYSIGLSRWYVQDLKIYQRRHASVSIASQKIHSSSGNRVFAWHPTYGFPNPKNPSDRNQLLPGLAVYLVKTTRGEVWAGWFQRGNTDLLPSSDATALRHISNMLAADCQEGTSGIMHYSSGDLTLNCEDPREAFFISKGTAIMSADTMADEEIELETGTSKTEVDTNKKRSRSRIQRSEEEILDSLFSEDLYGDDEDIEIKFARIRKRNQRAVRELKELYEHQCQISGKKYLFRKKDGTYYTEAHHLVPLGEGGADNPLNIVILSPLIHRMFHHADVQGLDLTKIKLNSDGSAKLRIRINNEKFTITWKKEHYETMMNFQSD